MDMKSMAKSKRSHTQHNKPRKPNNNTPKPTSSSKNPSILSKDKPKLVPPKPKLLPSNWDRYDENVEEDEGELAVESVSKELGKKAVCEEFRRPKSKGADFGYLVAQAKESNHHSPSFADSVDDFYQGLAPMLEVRSEGVPSWDRDDDFLLDSEATTSDEAPNFSLDLKALAEDLMKLDLAKRLFIEADLLPPELRGTEDNQVPEKRTITFETFEELYSIYLADEKIAEADANKESITSSSIDPSNSKSSKNMPRPSQVTEQVTERSLHDFGREVNQTSLPHLRDISRPAQVSSSLDDELDDLLNASNLNNKDGSIDYALRNLQEGPSRTPFPVVLSSLDDELDNLLEETSKPTMVKIDSAIFPSPSSSPSMDPGLKSTVVDDFDSWMDSL